MNKKLLPKQNITIGKDIISLPGNISIVDFIEDSLKQREELFLKSNILEKEKKGKDIFTTTELNDI